MKYFPIQEPWNTFRPTKVFSAQYPTFKTMMSLKQVQVIIIGAGIGGVASAVLISRKVPNSTITVYDKAFKIVSGVVSNC